MSKAEATNTTTLSRRHALLGALVAMPFAARAAEAIAPLPAEPVPPEPVAPVFESDEAEARFYLEKAADVVLRSPLCTRPALRVYIDVEKGIGGFV